MCGETQPDSPVLNLLASRGVYDGMIGQLPVENMIFTPNFIDIYHLDVMASVLLRDY